MIHNKIKEKAKFTGQNYGIKISYKFDEHINVEQAFDAMVNILIGLSFTHDEIKNCIINLAQEYAMKENND